MKLESKIEAILFWKGEPISIKKLGEILSVEKNEIEEALKSLEANLSGRGISLITKEDELMLATSPEISTLIEKLLKEELTKDLGKAGLETLSIILYRGPIKRSEIDYIRGVNSQFILRNLMIRGLVERISDPKDQRSYIYKPTFELLSYLGVKKLQELPEFENVQREMDEFKKNQEEAEIKEAEERLQEKSAENGSSQ